MMIKHCRLAFLFCALGSVDALWWGENKWVHAVKNGDIKKAHNVDCEALGTSGMKQCLKIDKQDETLSVVIKQCQRILPGGREYDKYAYDLYISNLPLSFHAYISSGRCTQLSREMMQHLLAAMVDNNSVDFVRSIVHQCVVNEEDWQAFIHRAEIMKRTEILLIVKNQGAFVGKPTGGFGAASWPSTGMPAPASGGFGTETQQQPYAPQPNYPLAGANQVPNFSYPHQQLPQQTQAQLVPQQQQWSPPQQRQTPQVDDGYQRVSQPSYPNQVLNSAPAINSGSYHGHLIKICPEVVSGNLLILAQITPAQATRFGLLGEGCVGLTATHFQQPGVSPATVGNLPLRCFQNIPPEAFAGLTAQMIERIKWWPYVSRDQVKFIQAGDPIRALPFDQLGLGRQKTPDDKIHPCWNITRAQIQSLKKDSTIYKEYSKRCVHSWAVRTGATMATFLSVTVTLFIMVL